MRSKNGTLMQAFHWYLPNDGQHWLDLTEKARSLAEVGITAVWVPPAYKGQAGGYDVGYGIYDLFDLGEFDQKGTVRTKYGTRDEFLAAIQALQRAGIQVYADIVFNHKDGGDTTERVRATPYHKNDRTCPIGELQEIEIYSRFTFPGRQGKYSTLQWDASMFDAVNHNMLRRGDDTIYLLEGKSFDRFVDLEKGNYAFLMACDLDFEHEIVCKELTDWGRWFLDTTGIDGFRLDAIKHIPCGFFVDWLKQMREHTQRDLFVVGEYWSQNINALNWYVEASGGQMYLFDVPLHYNFHYASRVGESYDIRRIFDGTLTQQHPTLAVTFVENHDSQPLQSLESLVESWFKPLAYALILLRKNSYPCIFWADYFGTRYKGRGWDGNEYEIVMNSHRWLIDKFLEARQNFAYGEQYDYFDHCNLIGWTRLGDAEHPKAMAVLLSNGPGGSKWMEVGKPNTRFRDLTEHIKEPIQTNADGWGLFSCKGGSVSVWVEAE